MIFFAHPKQCFLNETVLLSTSQKEAVTVEIQGVDTQCYTITEERPISIQLSAGTYKLVSRNEKNDTSIMTVEVFNAIRLGSPSHLKSYIFDANPWILLIKSDRTIFYNRENEKQYYENFITPEKVNELNSDLLLFENNATQGFWIFSTQLQQIIYSDENSSVKTFNSYQIIYEKDKSIYMLPLENFKEIKIGNIEDKDKLLIDNTTGCAFAFCDYYSINLFCAGKKHFISEKGFLSFISPHFAIFQDKSIIKILNLLEFPNSDIDNIITTKSGKQISIEYQAPKTTEHLPINSERYASYITQAQSKTGRFTLRKKDSTYAWVHEPENEDVIPLLHCFTIQSESVAKVTDALFTDDENIVLCKQEKDYKLYDLSRDVYSPFPNSDFVVRSVNGYNPIVQITNSYLGKPVLIDPVTLQHVKQEDLAQYTFTSPSSRYVLEKRELYCSKLNNDRFITKAELLKDENVLANGLYVNDSSLYIEIPIDNEKTYKEKWHDCIPMLVQKYESFLRKELPLNATSSTKDIEQYLMELTPERWNDLFYDEIIIIKDTQENCEVHLRIKGIFWFLNYVSFSYDDKYVAVVGRYHNNSFSGGYYGIFQTKDGSKLKEITHFERYFGEQVSRNPIYAAWVCAFTRDNKSAFYTSEPHTYLLKDIESHTISSQRIERKNFLCFSPDGKYMALSEQGYKCGFGHRRSTQVFIYSLDTDQMTQLPCYLGSSVKGLNRNRNVAACMFSQNNDRLLVSSDDGIVIVYALNGAQTFYHNKSKTNVSFGNEYTQKDYVEQNGKMDIRKDVNDGNITYTVTFGEKLGFVGKSVRDALNSGEQLRTDDLRVVIVSYQSIAHNGTIGKVETVPMLFLQPPTQQIKNKTYGKRYTLSQYEAEYGTCQISLQTNNDREEVIVCTINGKKAFVHKDVIYAIAHRKELHKNDLAILMMSYEETSRNGIVSSKTSPLLITSDILGIL